MAQFHCLTFLTDYGLEDAFVAVCHAVASQIAPDLRITDITHLIPPGDIRRGAVVLAQAVPYFPPAVHVAVVDPGVGTARRGVAVEAGGALFVGPDNGLLSVAVAAAGGAARAVVAYQQGCCGGIPRRPRSTAATSSCRSRRAWRPGMPLAEAGDPVEVTSLIALPQPECRITGDGARRGGGHRRPVRERAAFPARRRRAAGRAEPWRYRHAGLGRRRRSRCLSSRPSARSRRARRSATATAATGSPSRSPAATRRGASACGQERG